MNSKRYLVKAPIHQLYLDILLELFPDATLIYTYRPLTEVLTSAFSLYKHGIDPFGMSTESEKWKDRYGFNKKYPEHNRGGKKHEICSPLATPGVVFCFMQND